MMGRTRRFLCRTLGHKLRFSYPEGFDMHCARCGLFRVSTERRLEAIHMAALVDFFSPDRET